MPFYLYSTSQVANKYTKRYGLSLNIRKNVKNILIRFYFFYLKKSEVRIVDNDNGKSWNIDSNIQSCVNSAFDKSFLFNAYDSAIYKVNSYEKLTITPENI